MKKTVHILPPEIVAKIAAGEVIDRPASVIKELIENSLDANAASVSVSLEDAGKTAIVIKDDGDGIPEGDLETVFARHATSKISSADDLWDIHSLGFRGEALYSIAAVADVTLRSRPAGQDSGWEIHMRGGERIGLKPVGMNPGTEIEIRELFFNTPARRKFLKTNTTEMNQVLNSLIPYTLLYPKLAFTLSHQGKTVLDCPPAKDAVERAAAALNLDPEYILEARQEAEQDGISLHLLLGDINIARARRDMQFVFINGRPVQSKSVGFHMNDVYRLIFPPGRHPFYCVFIEMPAGELDVNIHPAKREVKVRNETVLTSLLRHVCEHTLMTRGGVKQAEGPSAVLPASEGAEPPVRSAVPDVQKALSRSSGAETAFDLSLPKEIFTSPSPRPAPTEQYTFPQKESFSIAGQTALSQKQAGLPDKLSRARYLGAFIQKYLLFEADQSLLVVDQHAAQERIVYEQLITQMKNSTVEVQHLLAPVVVKLSPNELLTWEESKDGLEQMGFSCSAFDEETLAVHAYPVLIKDIEKAVREILAGAPGARTDFETLARRACKASIRAGDRLTPPQAEFQRKQLTACQDPFTCPHGRPTVIELKEDFLNKQFLRT